MATQDEGESSRLVAMRLEGMPLAYIVGRREFYGLDLVVNPYVLIPRQETEVLVDKALELCASLGESRRVRIADAGTGSGAIAVAIAKHLPHAVVHATDVCRQALTVADVNRRNHGVRDRVHLVQADLLSPFGAPFDMIVSNPPYIRATDISRLAPEVRREPRSALDGGADGLELTRRLLRQAAGLIRPGGSVLVEIAPEQRDAACELAEFAIGPGSFSTVQDLLGLPRVIIATRG